MPDSLSTKCHVGVPVAQAHLSLCELSEFVGASTPTKCGHRDGDIGVF